MDARFRLPNSQIDGSQRIEVTTDEALVVKFFVHLIGLQQGLQRFIIITVTVLGIAEYAQHIAEEFVGFAILSQFLGAFPFLQSFFKQFHVIEAFCHQVVHQGVNHPWIGRRGTQVEGIGNFLVIQLA